MLSSFIDDALDMFREHVTLLHQPVGCILDPTQVVGAVRVAFLDRQARVATLLAFDSCFRKWNERSGHGN